MVAYVRRLEILDVLCQRRHEIMSNLANEFNVCRRTIQNDILELSLNFPLYTKPGYCGGVFVSDGYYRHFFEYDKYERTDYKYELETNNRIDVEIVNGLSFAPFVNYHLAKSRGADKSRSDTTVGLSLGYKTNYQIW